MRHAALTALQGGIKPESSCLSVKVAQFGAYGHHRKVAQMAPAGDLNKIVKPLLHKIIFSIARVYAGSSGVVLRNFTMVAARTLIFKPIDWPQKPATDPQDAFAGEVHIKRC
ncbi:MAG: hypothetical protein JZU64_06150 [Rhodoferax sp.]|nr:hypothetical protein [Rhodoferax sp.]